MSNNKKESRQFHISVEGINCEKMYFEHLATLINTSGLNKFNARINCRKISPEQFAKRMSHRPMEKVGGKKMPYIHVQDIEDYYDSMHQKKFYSLIDEIRRTEKVYGISYMLGYTNFTFELWMLLHVTDMNAAVMNRRLYLKPINQYFHTSFQCLDQFKNEKEFSRILDQFVTLDSVKAAIRRAENIIQEKKQGQQKLENYKNFKFYRDNPDLTVHEIVLLIFKVCGI